MLAGLFLLCLTGAAFARKPPDVRCILVNLEYVQCTWNGQGTPDVNYTFYSKFYNDKGFSECPNYISESSAVVGCNKAYQDLLRLRFSTFQTSLVYGNYTFEQSHNVKSKVKLNPPTNLTVKNATDSNLWFYWNITAGGGCVESEVRFRRNNKNWECYKLSPGKKNYPINLPSSSNLYELQVRSHIADLCGESDFWSEWSQPVFWGSISNSTDINPPILPVWAPVICVVGVLVLIILVMLLVQHERLRIILIPVVPKPGNLDDILIHPNVEDWLHISKDLKESFKANFNERPCPVREYSRVPQSASESSDSSTFSTTTDETDFAGSISASESEDLSTSCSSTSTLPVLSDQEQIAV
ncbi:cytokine receptor common subunit gamma-like [Myripristis murdjan]|uniref:Cytokine receptor common subunit gamma-like n=1 Tax=Myripristis murdjan TaxID=586833 RepID=A0A667YKW4_9TELE|nr:cytokine receptor common subunit gamma-like [Myripristis murdjan]